MPRGNPGIRRYRRPAPERFWPLVDKTGDCWLWLGHKFRDGRGIFMDEETQQASAAHRACWRMHFGAIPAGMRVRQRCKNVACVRPDHLYLWTAKIPLKKRFWEKVLIGDDCWEWQASRRTWGYGQTGVGNGKVRTAHRASWELVKGVIPAGLNVLHRCDNPPCVRPDHLFLGTLSDNMQDCAKKGRVKGGARKGEKHHKAKLTEAQVTEIRASADESDTALALRYSVSRGLIWFIRTNKVWKEAA